MINSDAAVGFSLNSVGCCVGTRASTCIAAYKAEPNYSTKISVLYKERNCSVLSEE